MLRLRNPFTFLKNALKYTTDSSAKTRNTFLSQSSMQSETKIDKVDSVPPPSSSAASVLGQSDSKSQSDIDLLLNIASKKVFVNVENLEQPLTEPEALKKSVSFDDVPGPAALKHIAKFWSFVPVVGTHVTASAIQYLLSAGSQLTWGSSNWLFRYLLDEYGPVVRLHGPFGGDVVILSRPEHASAVFQNEGPYPVRSSLDCVEKYRLQYRRYKQAGPFLMFGPEWEKLRKSIEEPLQKSVDQHYEKIEQTCDELISRIIRIRNRQEEVNASFKNEIYKWSMECLCSVTLNKRLGFLDPCGMSSTSEPARLLDGLIQATDAIRRCEYGLHLWKFMETPAWRALVKNCDIIDTILNKHVMRAQDYLRLKNQDCRNESRASNLFSRETDEKLPLLESLLLTKGVVAEDVLTVLLDMMLIGVNATSHTIAFLLYHLARNPRTQHTLFDEINKQVENPSKFHLQRMTYLQACIKESLRLKPPIPILSRVLNKDVLVHNYRIPKGTYVLIASHLSSLREEHFEDPLKFKPERWLVPDVHNEESFSFATIPFGHGAKACLARELAEIQVGLLIVKLLKKFRVEYHYGDINSTNKLLAQPDRPLKFRFVDRT